jgi:outer membrane protein insertion porin family
MSAPAFPPHTSAGGRRRQRASREFREHMTAFSRVLFLVLGVAFWQGAAGADAFVARDIRVEGLQRISAGTVFNYLPIKIGDTVDDQRTAEALRALFKTGLFEDVRLGREGEVLVVEVRERPAIGQIEFSGNKSMETDKLKESLKDIGFAEGRIFDQSLLDRVQQDLRELYFGQGRYAARVQTTVTPIERNRVAVNFDITEGPIARIRKITIIGNQSYEEEDLLDLLQLTTPGWFTFFTSNDQYSKQKLSGDLETLRSFYLDRGFVNFNIDSTQVSLSPDKEHVYITINISEGDRYRIGEVKLAGDLVVPADELFSLVTIARDEEFSRKKITETSAKISERLGDDGYAFANVNAIPDIQEKTKTVNLTFFVDPGKRVYVRRIEFKGNARTADQVLRREMRQMESAWISTSKVKRSQTRLERLGFFEEVNVETPAVPGTTDQVDVSVNVVERPAGSLMAGVGYAQTQGLILNAQLTQENFLGTGRRVQLIFNNSEVIETYLFSYTNPYWTVDGVSRGFDLYKRSIDAEQANIADYTTDRYGGNLIFGVPINEFDRINFGLGVEDVTIETGADPSNVVEDFIAREGDHYFLIPVTASWAHDTRNRAIFPDTGTFQRIGVEVDVPGGDLTYYKLFYRHEWYYPLTQSLTLHLSGDLGYGDGFGSTNELPFYENFFAGGIRSVRGFKDNTLGPRDDQDDPVGGNLKAVASVEVLFPLPFAKDSKQVRLGAFVDAGNVWNTYDDDSTVDVGSVRFSTGLAGTWYSPFGPLTVSVAVPLKDEETDETQAFQFTLGTVF